MVGRTISHYRVLAQLGKGGMGVVYKAEDTRLQRLVALKFLKKEDLTDDQKRRFLREARAVAQLNHPGICPLYDIAEVEGHLFLAMAYVDGKPLSRVIEKTGIS
ncbi:MAG: protein kinase, partial [bacterium]|nr:protein kinase [bacterium]